MKVSPSGLPTVTKAVVRVLDEALIHWHAAHPGQAPALLRVGRLVLTQLALEIVAAEPEPLRYLEVRQGQPVRYRDVEIFADDVAVDRVTVV